MENYVDIFLLPNDVSRASEVHLFMFCCRLFKAFSHFPALLIVLNEI